MQSSGTVHGVQLVLSKDQARSILLGPKLDIRLNPLLLRSLVVPRVVRLGLGIRLRLRFGFGLRLRFGSGLRLRVLGLRNGDLSVTRGSRRRFAALSVVVPVVTCQRKGKRVGISFMRS